MLGFDNKDIFIVGGKRTPFIKAKSKRGPFSASDLALAAARQLLLEQNFSADLIGEVILGCMIPSEKEANIARLLALRLGCGDSVPAYTVQRNCASGMQALDSAVKDIQLGRHDIVLAGGTEAMSRAPLIFQPDMVNWLGALNRAKTLPEKLALFSRFRLRFLAPIISLLHGLSDPLCGINMGQTAEELAHQFGISRLDMDRFSVQSQQSAYAAHKAGHFSDEMAVLCDSRGRTYDFDDGVRSDSSVERLGRLKPFFDRRYGAVTPGNSSQISDGACVMLLASGRAVKEHRLNVIGRIVDCEWAALNPKVMGLGPVMATTPMLQRQKLKLSDVDQWEINEAFAAQAIACLKAWESESFCQEHFQTPAWGQVDPQGLNIDGGAIALGHPVGATGARLVLHLLHTLKRTGGKRGVATLCIGGGQGGAMLVERV